MKKRILVCFAVFSAGAAWAAPGGDMLAAGEVTKVFETKERGLCVASVGTSEMTGKEARDREAARTAALSELAAYIGGTRVSSSTRNRIEVSDGKVAEAFLSEARTDVDAFLRGATFDTGVYEDQRYVYACVCQKSVAVSKDLKAQLRDNRVEAVGVASLDIGRDKARRQALDDALRNAVAQYAGVSSLSESSLKNGEELQSRQVTRSSGAVTHYKIVKETVLDGMVRIEVVAEIGEAKANSKDKNRVIREHLGRPSVYLDIKDPVAKKAFRELLSAADYEMTDDRRQARYELQVKTEILEAPALADMIGRRTSLVVRLKDRMSSDDAFVLRNDPDESLEVSDFEGIRASRSMARAVESIGDRLVGRLSKTMSDQFVNGSKVLVSFTNFGRMREAENLKRMLESFPLTKKVTLRPVDGGVAYYDVLYLGDPNDLQMMALKAAPDFRLNGLKAKNRTGNGLDFTF